MCKVCEGYDREYIHEGQKMFVSQKNPDAYVGIDISIDYDNSLLVECCADTYEPCVMEVSAKINFCPMCGRELRKEKEDG